MLRHRRPISFPFPNKHAHPLPKFTHSTETGEISVQFAHDPTYPSPEDTLSTDWQNKSFVLTCDAQRRKVRESSAPRRRSLFGKLFKSKKATHQSASASTPSTHRISKESGVMETSEHVTELQVQPEDWVEIPGSYTDKIRVVTVDTANTATDDHKLSEEAKQRYRWLVIPLKD